MLDFAVKKASEKGFNIINEELLEFISLVQVYEYLGDKGGDIH